MDTKRLLEIILITGIVGSFATGGVVYSLENARYNTLQSKYNMLLSKYNSLQASYTATADAYQKLLSNYSVLLEKYSLLSNNYTELQNKYTILNKTFFALKENYTTLKANYDDLMTAYEDLNESYTQLSSDYDKLTQLYEELNDTYVILNQTYWLYVNTLRNMPLPLKLTIFYEAVRRGEDYRFSSYDNYVALERDMILHDTAQYNAFEKYTLMFKDIFIFDYGSNSSMVEAWYSMYYSFYPWLPYWANSSYSEYTIHQWVVDNIDYEYDSNITWGINKTWDYPKFPVETAFRTLGDCEDQAILDSALLESCGYETIIAIVHDSNNPRYGPLYHGFLWVRAGSTYDEARNKYPNAILWFLPASGVDDYVWLLLDPTWDVPLGDTPAWLQAYIDENFNSWDSIFTYAVVAPPSAVSSLMQYSQVQFITFQT